MNLRGKIISTFLHDGVMVPEGESRESPSSALGREAEGTSRGMAGGLAWY